MNKQPKPGESWLTFFKKEGRFADAILIAWVTSEFWMNQLFCKQFGKYMDYPDAKILTDISFSRKLEYLKKNKVITLEEFKTIRKFVEFRNGLFHGKNPEYTVWSDSKKNKIIDDAIKATYILRDALSSGSKRKS